MFITKESAVAVNDLRVLGERKGRSPRLVLLEHVVNEV